MPKDVPAPVAGLVLAAGSSVRMGRNKLLFAFNGETIIRRAVRQALAVLDPVVVVLGHEADLVGAELAGLPCRTTVNPEHARGLHTSARAGLGALPADREAAVVLLADMPLVTSGMIARLVERHRQTNAPLVVSRYGETIAPPQLYTHSLFAELAASTGKEVIARHQAEAEIVAWPASALVDLDVPEDRDRVEALLAAES